MAEAEQGVLRRPMWGETQVPTAVCVLVGSMGMSSAAAASSEDDSEGAVRVMDDAETAGKF